MIRVCDAIMGTGKTSAAITYINEHPEKRFVFITPYLDEADRITQACPGAQFVQPSSGIEEYGFSKVRHTASLIRDGRNVATTHQAFKNYNAAMLETIREMQYTLIIDENVDILESFKVGAGDIEAFVAADRLAERDGVYSLGDQKYGGGAYNGLFGTLESRSLLSMDDSSGGVLFFWMLPPGLIAAFRDVIILTYMFEGQSLHHMLAMNGFEYEYMGIELTDDGVYRFVPRNVYVPEYAARLPELIHVLDVGWINEIGESRCALSMNWYKRGGKRIADVKANLYNYFHNYNEGGYADKRLCASFAGYAGRIKGKGYTKAIVPFNLRATNQYRDRTCLAYPVNVFMNAGERIYYNEHDVVVDEDAYALSTMVQWIWRSAIRDGHEIDIYIPSRRMRMLLTEWIKNVSKGVVTGVK